MKDEKQDLTPMGRVCDAIYKQELMAIKRARRRAWIDAASWLVAALAFAILTCVLFFSCAPPPSPASSASSEPQVPPYVAAKSRLQLQLDLLGEPLDRRWPNEITQVSDPYLGFGFRIRVDVDDLSMISYFIGSPTSRRLAIYHQGHSGDARILGRSSIFALRDAGWSVIVCSMPLRGENELLPVVPPATVGSDSHDDLAARPFPLRYFVWPVVESLTMAESFHGWDEVRMVGISGGGWTTMLVGALDERITSTYAVAGTWPKYLNNIHPGGRDLEQRLTQPDLLDLYALHQEGVFVYNDADPCCFSGEWYDGFLDPFPNVRAWVVENDRHSIAEEVVAEAIR